MTPLRSSSCHMIHSVGGLSVCVEETGLPGYLEGSATQAAGGVSKQPQNAESQIIPDHAAHLLYSQLRLPSAVPIIFIALCLYEYLECSREPIQPVANPPSVNHAWREVSHGGTAWRPWFLLKLRHILSSSAAGNSRAPASSISKLPHVGVGSRLVKLDGISVASV